MNRTQQKPRLQRLGGYGLLLGIPAAPMVAYSAVYMTAEQAAHEIFPGSVFQSKNTVLTADEISKIETSSGEKVRSPSLTVSVDASGNYLFIDQVLGKHEFITYAVGIDASGSVKDLQILEYRETYGQQVTASAWRRQFVGKTKTAPLKLNQDITNISGATLSSAHLTAGVRRILRTYEVLKSRS